MKCTPLSEYASNNGVVLRKKTISNFILCITKKVCISRVHNEEKMVENVDNHWASGTAENDA